MNNLPIPVSWTEFKNNVSIRFNNILDGFDKFENFTIDGNFSENSEACLINFLLQVFEENDNECYIDFYINKLNEIEIKNLMNLIDENDKTLLNSIISIKHNDVYYKITDKNLIPFFAKLNIKELFFVTFYFTKKPVTVWGNYNLKFPCFFNDDKTLSEIYDIAYKLNIIKNI
ncbi:hypothetical protein [uncultured Clostridium sp.]|uniref:hypothetical protein n=1 Tax=uncultured Clostridium sp. TaxID=59620 RepID=UPI0025FFD698|nr:hypothetical protein [uncultured Clostridium sp.]